jgi:uncharacterized protein (DUF433 family)
MNVEYAPRMTADPQTVFGKRADEGTGVPVDVVVGKLANGMTAEEVADDYGLMPEDVLATVSNSVSVLASDELLTLL